MLFWKSIISNRSVSVLSTFNSNYTVFKTNSFYLYFIVISMKNKSDTIANDLNRLASAPMSFHIYCNHDTWACGRTVIQEELEVFKYSCNSNSASWNTWCKSRSSCHTPGFVHSTTQDGAGLLYIYEILTIQLNYAFQTSLEKNMQNFLIFFNLKLFWPREYSTLRVTKIIATRNREAYMISERGRL